jgi:hypothetical protein
MKLLFNKFTYVLAGAFLMIILAFSTEGGKLIISGPASIIGALSITGTTTITGTTNITGTTTVTGALSTSGVSGTITASADLDAPGGFATQLNYWYQENVAANQSAVAISIVVPALTVKTELPTIRAGSVIGIVVYSNAARADGTLTVDATIDGAVTGLTAVLNAGATQTKATTQAKGLDTFTAGQRIGVKITTDANWLPITADITVSVLIEQ